MKEEINMYSAVDPIVSHTYTNMASCHKLEQSQACNHLIFQTTSMILHLSQSSESLVYLSFSFKDKHLHYDKILDQSINSCHQ